MYFSRGKNKVQHPYCLPDIYEYYTNYTGNNDMYNISKEEFSNIISDFYKNIVSAVLRKNIVFKMPYTMGSLRVVKTKVSLKRLNILSVNWKETVNQSKYIHHLNEHSRGYKYYFFWNKHNQKNKNMFFYRLVMTRSNKRTLAKLIKSNKYDYFEL